LGKREYLTKLTFKIGTVTYSILKKESQWPTKKFKIGTDYKYFKIGTANATLYSVCSH
jgi:hypothetical protein